MSILARRLLIDHKDNLLKYTSIYETYLREDTDTPFWLVTTNKLLNSYEGMDGLKTGYTSQAGYNLTATALKNNMRLISVVMGGSSSKSRNADITTLLNYGFNNYKSVVLYPKENVIKEINLENSKDKTYNLVSKEDISVVISKNENVDELIISVKINTLNIPISKDEIIGKIEIKDKKGNILANYDLYPQKDIVALSFLDTFINYLKLLF
jgi:D-alanyl-D-alanine carboxypeptidase (penicillin-binding protein 5/6)